MCLAGQDCDISVGSTCAIFKSTVIGILGDTDSRFRQLLRLVKLWAKAHDLNDATSGTLNSFALSLMVSCSPCAGTRTSSSTATAPAS